MPLTIHRADGSSSTVTGAEVLAEMAKHDIITESSTEGVLVMSSKERVRIYIDDATGKQIDSPDKATNGGSRQLQGADAERWLQENGTSKSTKQAEPVEDKAVAKAENKAKS